MKMFIAFPYSFYAIAMRFTSIPRWHSDGKQAIVNVAYVGDMP